MSVRRIAITAAVGGLALLGVTGAAQARPVAPASNPRPPSVHQPIMNKKVTGAAPGGITQYTSGNWAGYAALTGNSTTSFKSVTAQFEVPAVNCSKTGSGYSFAYHWVGLDGFSDSTVEQTGIADLCEAGSPVYDAWWETYPGPITLTVSVNPGDMIFASVTWNGSAYVMKETDVTQGTTLVNVTEPCQSGSTCSRSSAEVITEGYPSSPWLGTADYGRAIYDGMKVVNQAGTTGGITNGAWTAGEITAKNGSDLTSQPGPLYSEGSGSSQRSAMDVTWKAVS
ncbi:MAG: G1 family glutamic endopeptidase [Streptosporangiaceae bacterium]